MKILFSEKQRFTQWWLWALIIVVNALIIYGFVQQIIFKTPFGNNPAPDVVLILVNFIPLGIAYLFYVLRLETTITNEFIAFQFKPFQSKINTIRWEELGNAYVRTYKPIREFGGWGYRVSFTKGVAYNVSGHQGIQLVLKNGKKILIGTQKAEELRQILNDLNMK